MTYKVELDYTDKAKWKASLEVGCGASIVATAKKPLRALKRLCQALKQQGFSFDAKCTDVASTEAETTEALTALYQDVKVDLSPSRTTIMTDVPAGYFDASPQAEKKKTKKEPKPDKIVESLPKEEIKAEKKSSKAERKAKKAALKSAAKDPGPPQVLIRKADIKTPKSSYA